MRSRGGRAVWPVQAGAMPSLAGGVSARAAAVADLEAALVAGAEVVLVPARVVGEDSEGWLAPCGKTQLAVAVAESMWQSRGLELLLWVVATSRASVLSGFVDAAVDALGADPEGDGELVAARFLRWLGQTSRPWLVVLDDLRDMADLEGLRPMGPAGRVLITTAKPAAFTGDQGVLIYPVGALSQREALSQLTGSLTGDPDKRLGAQDLVADLGCEPLALAQASAVIGSSALSCSDYRACFAHKREQVTAAAGGSPPAAAVTWAISAEHADRLSPGGSGQALLALAAILDGHGIPATVFATSAAREYLAGAGDGNPADQLRGPETLVVAEQAGLLSVDVAGSVPLVRMSGVVQAAVRAAVPTGLLERAATAAANALLQVWPADDQPRWLAAALRSSAVSLQQATGDLLWATGCHPVLLRAGYSLDRARLTGPAVAYWSLLAAVSDRLLGRGHPDTLAVGEQLAGAYLAAGRAADAVWWFQWVLTERVRVLGPDHPRAIADRRDLGLALVAAHQFGDAVTVLDRVVGDYERVRGADKPETLGARDELAGAFHAAGQFAETIRVSRLTLGSRERVQGPEHPDTMSTRQALASAYLADGRLKTAISHYRRVLADRERILGPDDLDTIAVRGALGAAYYSAGRMASALQLYEQTRAAYLRALGADHPDTLASSADLARVYYDVGRVTDAMALLGDTLAHCEQALPPGDPMTLAVHQSLTAMAGG
jgi:tetratricopeptide (TPR) repeat protein